MLSPTPRGVPTSRNMVSGDRIHRGPPLLFPRGAEPREKRVVRVAVDTSYRKVSLRSCFPSPLLSHLPVKMRTFPSGLTYSKSSFLPARGARRLSVSWVSVAVPASNRKISRLARSGYWLKKKYRGGSDPTNNMCPSMAI